MTYERDPQTQDPAIIDTEIIAGLEQAGSAFGYINNFTENLSGGMYRSQVEEIGWMDRVMADSRYQAGSEEALNSARAYATTWRQFFADVDRAVVESGIDTVELECLQALADQPSLERGQVQEAHSRYALPIYRQLRILGYSHFDLRR